MENLKNGTEIAGEISLELMQKTLECFSGLHRYSGSEQGEEAVLYIKSYLAQHGVPCEIVSYDCFRSLPVSAGIRTEDREYEAMAAVYSGNADGLRAELYYDEASEKDRLSELENRERLKAFCGKIILTNDRAGEFAKTAYDAGALGVIVIWPQTEPLLHHMTIGTVWGNPTIHDMHRYSRIPYVEVTNATGQELKRLCEEKNCARSACEAGNFKTEQDEETCGTSRCEIELNVKMDDRVIKTSMPVVTIPGKSEKYVLISGHYDSWYEGITDNATANAATLECARILYKYRHLLKRGVKVAFWSGHSDGRYAGSSWFVDQNWEDLNQNCVAHINLDLIGGKNDELVSRGSSLMEKEGLPESIIEEFSGVRPVLKKGLTRAGDESFSGVGVPLSMLSRFESRQDGEYAQWAGSYAPWWHSVDDTLDKVDYEFLLRDAKINLKIVWEILQADRLPVDMHRFADRTEDMLKEIQKDCAEDFNPQCVLDRVKELKAALVRLDRAIMEFAPEDTDTIIKKVSGGMVRLHYTYGSPYYHDPAYGGYSDLHIFQMMRGVTRENTTPETYLMYQTDFRRQCNRQRAEMQKLIEAIDVQIDRWKYGR